ncbi:MAG: hypothetical protein KKC80_05380, partial [Candidatus Margulisbacteria bacterium]|nr:hypothetical protein [Candidatus Margulisiibacteriota bacterium]
FLLTAYSLALITGCARTVTQIVPSGAEMVVEATMLGTVETTANRYFMVLSDSAGYKVQLPLPQPAGGRDELLEPGTTPMYGSREAYYINYYSTWSGYIITDPAGYFLVKGPFIFGASTTREVLSTTAASGNKLLFSFRLDQIFGATIPDTVYFDLITVPWPDGAEKIPADHLQMSNYVSKVAGTELTIVDDSDSSAAPSLDISKVVIRIQ